VYKLYPGATPPDFTYEVIEPRRLVMGYTSARRMCALAEGLIRGTAAHFGETIEVVQTTCMHRGDASCTIEVTVVEPGATG
jgi:predicted hydrocarbon binding protein